MGIVQYLKARCTRAGAFGAVGYTVVLVLSLIYLWHRLSLPGTLFFSFVAAETADRFARWFA
jgi:hypothetical protein